MPPDPDDTAESLRRQAEAARRIANDTSLHDAEHLRQVADDLEARAAELKAADDGEAGIEGLAGVSG